MPGSNGRYIFWSMASDASRRLIVSSGLSASALVALRPHAGDAAHHLVHGNVRPARRAWTWEIGKVRVLAKDHERRSADHVAPRFLRRNAVQVELVPARQRRLDPETPAATSPLSITSPQ